MLHRHRFVAVIVMILFEYFLAVLLSLKLYQVQSSKEDNAMHPGMQNLAGHPALIPLRALFALYFFFVGFLWHTVLYPHSWDYFTNWNMFIIVFYFGFVGLCFGLKDRAPCFRFMLSKLFVVVATSSFFTTAVTFTVISSSMDFWNVVMHLSTSICLIFEMALNDIIVYCWDFIFCLTWSVLYLSVVWLAVGTGVKDWPYEFLRIDTSSCFSWYTLLLLGNLFFFAVIWSICHWKQRLIKSGRIKTPTHFLFFTYSTTEDGENLDFVDAPSSFCSCSSVIYRFFTCTCVERAKQHRFQVILPVDDSLSDTDYSIIL